VFARATIFQRFGHLAEARMAYKKVLKKQPGHFEALHMLGICEYESGNSLSAVTLLKRALHVDPQSAAAGCDLGIILVALQQPDEALACFDRVVDLHPNYANAHFERGNLLLGRGQIAEAIASLDKAITIDPCHVNALISKGSALNKRGSFADAIACNNTVLATEPANVTALVNRGIAFKNLRQAEKALADFDMSLAIDPGYTLGWLNRGDALFLLGRVDESLASVDRALSIDPDIAVGWIFRAKILMRNGNLTEALDACRRALAIEPGSVMALIQFGQCQALRGEAQDALTCFDRALAVQPDNEFALSNKIFILDFIPDAGFARHQAIRSEWWSQIGSKVSQGVPQQHTNDRDPERRIVLGYVSADFREHSAAFAFRPVLTGHDKTRFEVICYSASPTEDAVTLSFRKAADRWRNVTQWSDDQLVDSIRADKVDILIDLAGHSDGNRLRVFARKPAPVQLTAWGHATGTGLPTIDYLFSDPVAIPADVRGLYAEKIYDLPCLAIIEPPSAEFRSAESPVDSNGYLTYGVFNRVSKISDPVVAVWARILRSDMTSRLLIKDRAIDDASVRSMLLERFTVHGIDPDRITLMGSTSRDQHLASYRQVDICLDPFPQGGGVSTWEALHMGVPVVAKLGTDFAGRVAGSILSATAMDEWVARDDDEYVAIALRRAPGRLTAIRRELPGLIDQRCGPVSYTAAVEQAYRTMWRRYCRESGLG
jgi:predicted O-linked N-acetylglucosamine transferase (SPINDLY family)